MEIDDLISFLNYKNIKTGPFLGRLKNNISALDLYIFRSHDYIRFYRKETYQKTDSYLALWAKHEQGLIRLDFEVIKNESTCLTEFGARWYLDEDQALDLATEALKLVSNTDPHNITSVSDIFRALNF